MSFAARAAVMSACLLLVSCAAERSSLVILVTPEEPAPTIAASIQPLLESIGYAVEIRSIDDPMEVFELIDAGAADLGIVEEPDEPRSGLATVLPLYPTLLHVLHRSDMQPGGFEEVIRGHSVYPGPQGGAGWRLLQLLAENFGLSSEDYRILDNPWLEEPEVFFQFGGLFSDAEQRQLGEQDYQLFSFGEVARLGQGTVAEGIVLRNPRLRTFVIPAATYPKLSKSPVLTLAARSILVGREDFDPKHAYLISEHLFEHAQDVGAGYHLVSHELTETMSSDSLALALHPGVRRYVEKDRPSFVERYVEVIALGITVIAGIGSGLITLYNYRRSQKKDRIDVYYNRALALRARMERSEAVPELLGIEKEMKGLQEEVMALLVDERLDANHALTIFMTLSSQVLAETRSKLAVVEGRV